MAFCLAQLARGTLAAITTLAAHRSLAAILTLAAHRYLAAHRSLAAISTLAAHRSLAAISTLAAHRSMTASLTMHEVVFHGLFTIQRITHHVSQLPIKSLGIGQHFFTIHNLYSTVNRKLSQTAMQKIKYKCIKLTKYK
jgi:hypothetical protein